VSELSITFPAEAFRRVTERAADGTMKRGQTVAQRAVQRHQRAMSDSFRGYSGTKGDQLQRRSGFLKRSFGVGLDPNAPTSFSAGIRYAKLQEYGGVVKPTGGRRFLTIPLKAALTAGGVFRPAARLVNRGGGWQTASTLPGARDTQTWIRNGVIFVKGANGKPLPVYALKSSVKIPARLRFFATWEAQSAARDADFAKAIDGGVEEAVR